MHDHTNRILTLRIRGGGGSTFPTSHIHKIYNFKVTPIIKKKYISHILTHQSEIFYFRLFTMINATVQCYNSITKE